MADKKRELPSDLADMIGDINKLDAKLDTRPKAKKHGRQIDDKIISYEYKDSDKPLVRIMKEIINEQQIKKSRVYEVMRQSYDDPTKAREQGYNFIYALDKNQMSWDRIERWGAILNARPILTFEPIDPSDPDYIPDNTEDEE